MSYTRPMADGDGLDPLFACSICGVPYLRSELVYRSDRLWYCTRTCNTKHIPFEEDKKNGMTLRRKERVAPGRVGVDPYPSGVYEDMEAGILDLIIRNAPYDAW